MHLKAIFQDLSYSAQNNTLLRDWVKAAGITKYVTFHGFRHTYATLQLSHGTDIYTVSKLLGHRELKTT
ncbi:tyrosine-type recombinase/integrase [Pontibacter flavimaris]|uniref:tyrosine-type recombinase/integrase n=1 Tax=Pontibacter flavimaris TaxID=1797110 RepID=UPI002936EFA2|nr:tyrosine-type recombinase/integrase [Pontibacter flavimaris]